MDNLKDYNSLLKEYQDLQLRVTRFSSVEQQLINTRDQLDHELVLYKRLNKFNSYSLKDSSEQEFVTLIGESIIDILEVESAVVYILKNNDVNDALFFTEGIDLKDSSNHDIKSQILLIGEKFELGKSNIISENIMNFHSEFCEFSKGVFYSFYDKDSKIRGYLFGLNSKLNAPLYKELQLSHETIFSIFAQQVQSILSNRKKSQKIQEQIEKISISEIEQRKLSLIATKTKNGVIISDSFGRIEWVNDAFIKASGYELAEVKGLKPKDFLQGQETDFIVRKQLSHALANKENIEVKIVNYHKNGQTYHSLLEITAVFNEKGEHTNFIALQKDITNEVIYQQDILRINSRFDLIASKSQIGIWEWEVVSNKMVWNDVLIFQYGAKRSLIESNFLNFWKGSIHPDDSEKIISEQKKLIFNKDQEILEQEFRIIKYDNQEIRILKALTIVERDKDKKLLRLVGSSIDVTEAREAEIKLKKSEEKYRNIIENMNLGLIERDIYGNIIYANNQFYDLTLLNSSASIIIKDDKPTINNDLIGESEIINYNKLDEQSYEVDFKRKDGKIINLLLNKAPVLNEKNHIVGFINVYLDITTEKQIQESILKSNKELIKINSELDNFVYSVSHDLRSPLLSIKGILSLVFKTTTVDEKVTTYLKMAEKSILKLDDTIQEILDYSRNSRLDIQLESFNIREMIASIFEDLRFSTTNAVNFSINIEGEDTIFSDKVRINTLFKNIIGNAVKYIQTDIHDSFVNFDLKRNKESIIIQVTDNGEGISEDKLGRVFEMFYRGSKKSAGTGLGLYICKEIIVKLKGEIDIKSTINKGTTVTIVLPNLLTNE